MNLARITGLAVALLFATSCGKAGVPLPPIIRTPEAVTDLTVAQSGYNIVLAWTNPARYIDGNPATDLSTVRILKNGMDLASVAASGPGQRQSYSIDATSSLSTDQVFSIRVESAKGTVSAFSNSFVIRPVDVPGPVEGLKANPDQFVIRVYWQFPARNPNLARSYIVQRSDKPSPTIATDLFFDDMEVEAGKSYTYTVTPALGEEGGIPGPAAPPVTVANVDKAAPQVPVGLQIEPDLAGGVFLTWNDNTERDLAGYRIYRSDRQDGGFVRLNPMPWAPNGFSDKDYRPGFFYRISAEDVFGNESAQSAAERGP